MNSCAITVLISALANTMAANLTVEEIELLAVLFTQLGDTLATIATIKTIKNPAENADEAIL